MCPGARLLYTYPGMVTDRLIELMAGNNQLLPYLDMPLQHADPTVLKAMSRPSNIEWVTQTIARMRQLIPNLVVRTTMIVGYPQESQKSFETLQSFIKEIQFDHLGVFTYSPEMDTAAYSLADTIPSEVKESRKQALMELQAGISLASLKKLQGKRLDMLVEGVNPEERLLVGRTYRDAPEIDGLAIAAGKADEGEIVPIQIIDTTEYDLIGKLVKKITSIFWRLSFCFRVLRLVLQSAVALPCHQTELASLPEEVQGLWVDWHTLQRMRGGHLDVRIDSDSKRLVVVRTGGAIVALRRVLIAQAIKPNSVAFCRCHTSQIRKVGHLGVKLPKDFHHTWPIDIPIACAGQVSGCPAFSAGSLRIHRAKRGCHCQVIHALLQFASPNPLDAPIAQRDEVKPIHIHRPVVVIGLFQRLNCLNS